MSHACTILNPTMKTEVQGNGYLYQVKTLLMYIYMYSLPDMHTCYMQHTA